MLAMESVALEEGVDNVPLIKCGNSVSYNSSIVHTALTLSYAPCSASFFL